MGLRKIMLGVIVLGTLTVSGAYAQTYREEGIRIGQNEFKDMNGIPVGSAARLKMGVSTEALYDSNVYLTSNNKKHDYINVTSPKFLLDVPMGIDQRHLLQLLYTADVGTFSDQKSQNYVNQNAAANLNLRLPFGYFNVNNDFKDTVDRASTEFTSQVRRKENRASAALGVEINKLTYEAAYANFLKRYYDKDFQNVEYNEDIYTGTVLYQLFPKTKALVEYSHGVVDYTKNSSRDGHYDQGMVGLKGQLTGKTVGVVKMGYQKREYNTSSRNGYEGFISETGIITDFSERTQVELKYLKNAVESTYENNSYYDMHAVILDIKQKLMGNFSILLNSKLARHLYPENDADINKKRKDTLLSEGLTLQYSIKDWGKVNLGYQYLEDISNEDSQSYNDHQVFLRFDFLI